MATATIPLSSRADHEWGYPFGVDGLMTKKEVAEHIRRSEKFVDNLCRAGRLRKGKDGTDQQARVLICRRSVQRYVHGLEF